MVFNYNKKSLPLKYYCYFQENFIKMVLIDPIFLLKYILHLFYYTDEFHRLLNNVEFILLDKLKVAFESCFSSIHRFKNFNL